MDEKYDEKNNFRASGGEAPPYEAGVDRLVEDKGLRIGEAADMYGDLQTAEEYGYVSRGLKSRHIQFIALGGTIGTGLFLSIGKSLTQSGPLSLLLGYTLTGIAIYAMVGSNVVPFFVARDRADKELFRCKVWARWQHGCRFPEQSRNSVLATSMELWDLLSVGT